MRRRFNLLFAVLFTVLSWGVSANAEKPKIATVDMQKIFRQYHRTLDAQKRFNLAYANVQKGVNERLQACNRIKLEIKERNRELANKELGAAEKALKEKEVRLMMQELNLMNEDIRRFGAAEKRKIELLKQASMQGIMQDIRQRVSVEASEQGYDYVFDKSGKNTNQVSFFIYLDGVEDLTAQVLQKLNQPIPEGDPR